MREPRIAVMILGEASWEDANRRVRTVPVRMEDKSAGGACLRVGVEIAVGCRLRVRCRHEQFTGVSKYCREDGKEFLVGLQRDKSMIAAAAAEASSAKTEGRSDAGAKPAEPVKEAVAAAEKKVVTASVAPAAATMPPARAATSNEEQAVTPRPEGDSVGAEGERAVKEQGSGETRKPMRSKLLELAHWRSRKDGADGNGKGETGDGETAPPRLQEKVDAEPRPVNSARFQVELLSTDDIYRSAGIMNLRGYSVHKVVEMLRNEHIRGLSKEMRRAAVLMALDAAGIPVDQVLRDARARTEALDSYETEQRQRLESEWNRKAEENLQIQVELERVKEQYMARMSRNLESVAREKATFTTWLTSKQQESQSIADAADLCEKSSPAKTPEVAMAAALQQ